MDFATLAALNEDAFRVQWDNDSTEVARAIAVKFGLDKNLVHDLAQYDYQSLSGSSTATLRRKDSLKTKILSRFTVIEKNRRIMEKIGGAFDGFDKERGYLDVGCGMALTLFDAKKLGFSRCHGLEVDPNFDTRAQIVCASMNSPDVKAELSDFLTHDFSTKYDFITFFDVFEHVADRNLALKRAADLLTEDGIIYIYQGNFQSSEIVRTEPHYRVPGLSLLPPARQVELLLKMGKITTPKDFVVNDWPQIELFTSESQLSCALNLSSRNIRADRPYRIYDENIRQLRGMLNEPRVWVFERSDRLDPTDIEELQGGIAALVDRMDASDATSSDFNVRYNMGSWELLLTHANSDRKIAPFQPLKDVLNLPEFS